MKTETLFPKNKNKFNYMMKMEMKTLKGFFLTILSILVLASVVTASASEIVTVDSVEVNGIEGDVDQAIAVIAGETVPVEVYFTALESTSDVKVEAEVTGGKTDVSSVSTSFDIERGLTYRKKLVLNIPSELKDEVSDNLHMEIEIWNEDYKTEHELTLRVQRATYSADIMSISASQSIGAGELYPVDIALKNTGYNKLNDVYVEVSIPGLGIERESYFGDLVAVEDYSNNDVETGRFYLKIPEDAKAGSYNLKAKASNSDLSVERSKQITIENDFSGPIVVPEARKIASINQDVDYDVILVNPTNKLKVYRVVVETSGDVLAEAETKLVSVPAGLTKKTTITASVSERGEYPFSVNIFSGETFEGKADLVLDTRNGKNNGATVALTVILAVIFAVLLVVLIVLLGKKSKKNEDFGESYY